MRIVFFGTSPFAVPALQALHDSGSHTVLAVVTQPDRPSGRKGEVVFSPVKKLALTLGYSVLQPEKVRRLAVVEEMRALAPDILVVVSFGQIISQKLLDVPAFGGVNIHASLLPRWRGAAPIHYAILAGDAETGVATMQMEAGLDTGPILLEHREAILPTDTTLSLEPRLAQAGAHLLLETLVGLENQTIKPRTQPEEGMTYAKPVTREDGFLDPQNQTAHVLDCQIRALSPQPGAWIEIAGKEIKVLEAKIIEAKIIEDVAAPEAVAGTVVGKDKTGIPIATREGTLLLTRVQPPSKPVLDATAYANGARFVGGEIARKPVGNAP
jgi:methionyl-tRNA formyltransferase